MLLLRSAGLVCSILLLAACASPAAADATDSAAETAASGPACGLDQDGSTHDCKPTEFCDDDLVGICLPLAEQGPRCGMMPSGQTPFFCLATEYCADEAQAKCLPATWRGDACGKQPSGDPHYCEVGEFCFDADAAACLPSDQEGVACGATFCTTSQQCTNGTCS